MSYTLLTRIATRRHWNLWALMYQRRTMPLLCSIGSRTMASGRKVLQDIALRPNETHDQKNARLKRPLSPHLTIYRPGYTSILSILHRITGTVFSAYVVCLSAFAVLLPYDFEQVACSIENLNPPTFVVLASRFVLAFPFIYHSFNGVRHLMWDTGRCLALKQVFITGMVMLTVVAVFTGIAITI